MTLEDILLQDDVIKSIKDNLDELLELVPEIKGIINFAHNNPYHHLDVWNHTLYALSMSPNNIYIRVSLLFHDIGKPYSCQVDEVGIRHFYGHPIKSAYITKNALKRLGYSDDFINVIYYLVLNHDNIIHKSDIIDNYTLEQYRFEIQKCDIKAHKQSVLIKKRKYLNKVEEYLKTSI